MIVLSGVEGPLDLTEQETSMLSRWAIPVIALQMCRFLCMLDERFCPSLAKTYPPLNIINMNR